MNTRVSSPAARLRAQWREIDDLRQTLGLLEWDQETQMPAAGHEGRANALGTLAGLMHRATTAPALIEAIEAAAELAGADSLLAAQVVAARRVVDRALRVPEALARSLAEAKSRAFVVWQQARADADFAAFAPHLATLLDLKREESAAIDGNRSAYDVMLDDFESGSTEAQLVPLFDHLRGVLSPLVQAVASCGRTVDESVARGPFGGGAVDGGSVAGGSVAGGSVAGGRQRDFGREMAAAFGFDFKAGRLDLSTHPFCVGVNPRDVRLTCRFDDDDFRSCLFGILHEAGHGMFEQGIPEALRATPLADIHSLGVHESQSRLWENHVGRSLGFWRWASARLCAAFPGFSVTPEAIWPALHTVQPTLIRVEADEATYNLHVAIRFELERALFRHELTVEDLPAAWNDAYHQTLGIRPENDAEGVLQDVHWSHAIFGYFPTYTLGTMAAAQLFAAAGNELGDLEASFSRGEFAPLLAWLREKVHHHAGRYGVEEQMLLATGKPLSAAPLLDYLRATTEAVYGV